MTCKEWNKLTREEKQQWLKDHNVEIEYTGQKIGGLRLFKTKNNLIFP